MQSRPNLAALLGPRDGSVVSAQDGTRYVLSNVALGGCTFRRVDPKVRGKRARREERKARRRHRLELRGIVPQPWPQVGRIAFDLASGPDQTAEVSRNAAGELVIDRRTSS